MSSSPDYATTKSPDREESPRRRSPSRSRSPPRRRERSYSPSRSSSDRKPNRLFIGNLPKGQDAPSDRDISDLFSKYGKILSTTAKEGFAFVEFENEDDMKEAMEREDGATFRRYQIRVQLSHASSGDGRSRRQPGQGKCFNCQGFGHWARDCTEKRRDDRDRRGGYGGRDNYRNDRGGYRDRGDRGGDRGGDRSDDRGDRGDRRGGYGRDYGDNNGYGGPARREREDRAGSGPYTRSP